MQTLTDVEPARLRELPVAEEMQMGMSLGLTLDGKVPISIFPRWNFCCARLISWLTTLMVGPMSGGTYKPKIIIRTGIGSVSPFTAKSTCW